MKAFAPGIYPRSEALVQATRDLERGRTSPEAVAEQEQRDFQELVSVQRAAGLSFLSDGMLGWQDLFRPLADAAEGLDARPLTRFLDTNTFYRAVLVDGEPHLATPLPAPDLPAGEWVGTLPSPLAFARAARDEVSAQKLAANVLAPQIAAWAGGRRRHDRPQRPVPRARGRGGRAPRRPGRAPRGRPAFAPAPLRRRVVRTARTSRGAASRRSASTSIRRA